MDNEITTGAQRAVGDAFQWRVLALEQAKQDHEIRLREVEHGVSVMSERVGNVDEKIDAILRKLDEATQGKISQYSSLAVTIVAVVLAAVFEHFWK